MINLPKITLGSYSIGFGIPDRVPLGSFIKGSHICLGGYWYEILEDGERREEVYQEAIRQLSNHIHLINESRGRDKTS